jgi:antitoxin FitA
MQAAEAALMTELRVRGIEPELRARLRNRADSEGLSLSQYVVRLIEQDLALPGRREWQELLRGDQPVEPTEPVVEALDQVRMDRRSELGPALTDRGRGRRTVGH